MKHYACPGWKCPVCGKVVTLTANDEAPDYCYKCPSCEAVTGADEWTEAKGAKTGAEAKKIIEQFAKEQRAGRFACPRCGMWKMADNVLRNALSRAADVYICDNCGMDEAIRDFIGSPLPLTKWAIVCSDG